MTRPISEERADDLIDCLADAAVYREQAENPHVSAADAMLAEARAEIKAALISTSASLRVVREALEEAKGKIEAHAIYSTEGPMLGGYCIECSARWNDRTKPETPRHKPACILTKIGAALSLAGEDEQARPAPNGNEGHN